MLVPLSWLQKYVKIDLPPKEIAQMLTMAGIEVNEFKVIGGHLVLSQLHASRRKTIYSRKSCKN